MLEPLEGPGTDSEDPGTDPCTSGIVCCAPSIPGMVCGIDGTDGIVGTLFGPFGADPPVALKSDPMRSSRGVPSSVYDIKEVIR